MKNSLFLGIILPLGLFFLSCETKEKLKTTIPPHKVSEFTPVPTKSTIALSINTSELLENIDVLDFGGLSFIKKEWEQLKTIIDTNSRSYYYKKGETQVICLAAYSNQKAKSFVKDIPILLPFHTPFGAFNIHIKNSYLHIGFNEAKQRNYISSTLFPESEHTLAGFFKTTNDSLAITCTVRQLSKWSGSIASQHLLFEPITNLEIDTSFVYGTLKLSKGTLKKTQELAPKSIADYFNYINGLFSFAYSGLEADTVTITNSIFNEEDFSYHHEKQETINQYHKFSIRLQTTSKKETKDLRKKLLKDHLVVKRKKEYLATYTTTKTSFKFKDNQCEISNKKHQNKIDYSGLGFISINNQKNILQGIRVPFTSITQSDWLTSHIKSLNTNNLNSSSFAFDMRLDDSSKNIQEIINLFLSSNSL